ncbi:MAG: DUF1003 domain-containing protein [Mangrovibacterium sp.]
MKTFYSDLSGKEFPVSEKISGKSLRHSILDLIRKDYPQFTIEGYLSLEELNYYREKYIADYLSEQIGELSQFEKTVLDALTNKSTITDKIDGDDMQSLTFGQKIADKVADFGGSWTFIISFALVIVLWTSINVFWLMNKGFDPYPFILLNLLLSCLAALQAPVIMMSQNRQEEKDRERAKNDYMINLKSELEIRTLHEKIDHLMLHQQQELLEIQKVQIEMMSDILTQIAKTKSDE